jgi:hypothetical protein
MAAAMTSTNPAHIYEVRPRKDKRGFDLISDALPFGRLWYGEPNAIDNAIGYAQFYSRSHDAVIRVYDEAGSVLETHKHNAISESGESVTTINSPQTGESPVPLPEMLSGFHRRAQ